MYTRFANFQEATDWLKPPWCIWNINAHTNGADVIVLKDKQSQ